MKFFRNLILVNVCLILSNIMSRAECGRSDSINYTDFSKFADAKIVYKNGLCNVCLTLVNPSNKTYKFANCDYSDANQKFTFKRKGALSNYNIYIKNTLLESHLEFDSSGMRILPADEEDNYVITQSGSFLCLTFKDYQTYDLASHFSECSLLTFLTSQKFLIKNNYNPTLIFKVTTAFIDHESNRIVNYSKYFNEIRFKRINQAITESEHKALINYDSVDAYLQPSNTYIPIITQYRRTCDYEHRVETPETVTQCYTNPQDHGFMNIPLYRQDVFNYYPKVIEAFSANSCAPQRTETGGVQYGVISLKYIDKSDPSKFFWGDISPDGTGQLRSRPLGITRGNYTVYQECYGYLQDVEVLCYFNSDPPYSITFYYGNKDKFYSYPEGVYSWETSLGYKTLNQFYDLYSVTFRCGHISGAALSQVHFHGNYAYQVGCTKNAYSVNTADYKTGWVTLPNYCAKTSTTTTAAECQLGCLNNFKIDCGLYAISYLLFDSQSYSYLDGDYDVFKIAVYYECVKIKPALVYKKTTSKSSNNCISNIGNLNFAVSDNEVVMAFKFTTDHTIDSCYVNQGTSSVETTIAMLK